VASVWLLVSACLLSLPLPFLWAFSDPDCVRGPLGLTIFFYFLLTLCDHLSCLHMGSLRLENFFFYLAVSTACMTKPRMFGFRSLMETD
jgi:hypothetical protein